MGKLFNKPSQVRNISQLNTGLDLLGSIVSNFNDKDSEISKFPNLTTVPTLVSRSSSAPNWPVFSISVYFYYNRLTGKIVFPETLQ